MKEDHLQNLLEFENLCQELQSLVEERYYKKDGSLKKRGIYGNFCYYPIYRQCFEPIKYMIEICDFFGLKHFEKWKPDLVDWVSLLEDPWRLQAGKAKFKEISETIQDIFSGATEELEEAISLLDSREIDRLNEALHCFLEGCYHSSVAMSVSAIEFRLYSLMMSICPNPKLEELTLGQLIREYLDDKQKYGKVIPKKHEPLLEHCNTYRIFSVHPKKERINKLVASSILNMTFLFLLDKKLKKKESNKKN